VDQAPDPLEERDARDTQLPPGLVAKVAPITPQQFVLQVTIDQSTYDKLRHAQALLGLQSSSGDVAELLHRALRTLIQRLEKRRLTATQGRRPGGRRPAAS
jgi:hypothetical protein